MAQRIEQALPPYEQVARHLREQITSGALSPGDQIPSERDLVEEWGISRATATKAVAALRSQGLVRSVIGVGTMVAAPTVRTQSPRDRYQQAHGRGRMSAEDEDVSIETMPTKASDEVREALLLEDDHDEVIARSRVVSRDKVVVELSTSWFDAAILEQCPALRHVDKVAGGTTTYVAECLGLRSISVYDDVTAELADKDTAAQFAIERPAALLVTRVIVLDEAYGPFAYEVYRHRPGHHNRYTYDL